ncbi:hypothetical protein DEO72_LG6g369 [Vigna unguiculata]|uniref:Uncharacterized protein n=1 Tax=Vigna unguiculata TaxID=3917 RepID=A0A4D6M6R4_VIGUN|nr:hypothetical protein DEO72_LG6g369 [Vigna unguiculata]
MHSTFLPCQTISTILSTQTLSTFVPYETLSIRIALSLFLPPQTVATSLTPPETLSSNPNFFSYSQLFLCFCASISLTPPQTLSIALESHSPPFCLLKP